MGNCRRETEEKGERAGRWEVGGGGRGGQLQVRRRYHPPLSGGAQAGLVHGAPGCSSPVARPLKSPVPKFPAPTPGGPQTLKPRHAKSSLQKKKKEEKTPERKEAPAGRGRGGGPRRGLRVRVPQCSSLDVSEEMQLAFQTAALAFSWGTRIYIIWKGPALRRRPRAFASNVRVETDLQILGELLVEARRAENR